MASGGNEQQTGFLAAVAAASRFLAPRGSTTRRGPRRPPARCTVAAARRHGLGGPWTPRTWREELVVVVGRLDELGLLRRPSGRRHSRCLLGLRSMTGGDGAGGCS
jgi:hypothetical protein